MHTRTLHEWALHLLVIGGRGGRMTRLSFPRTLRNLQHILRAFCPHGTFPNLGSHNATKGMWPKWSKWPSDGWEKGRRPCVGEMTLLR